MEPRIQYVTTADGVSIAYCETGAGYPLFHLPGPPFTHVQNEMRMPSYGDNNRLIADRFHQVRFDCRGTGLSDRNIEPPALEDFCRDLDAVANHLGLERFAVVGTQAGGLVALRYALDNPGRVSHLVLWDAYPSGEGYREIPQVKAFLAMMENDYEMFTEALASVMFGWSAGEARDYARYLRECVSAEDCRRFFDAFNDVDLTAELESVAQPTLVLHHKTIPLPDMATARLLAARIPDSHLVLLEGTWNVPGDDREVLVRALVDLIGGDSGRAPPPSSTIGRAVSSVLDAVNRFQEQDERRRLAREPRGTTLGGFATILFTDVEGSTALTDHMGDAAAREVLREHERITREALRAHGGSEVKTMGDGFMASFGSATKALECAIAIQRSQEAGNRSQGIRVRCGLNAGEPIAEADDLFGTAVIVAARIAALAKGGEVLVSDVVRQLVAGKGFLFNDRGEHALKGFEDPVRVYEVSWRDQG
jgi:class 3 adenylate cyclase/pimeloyl-ACP methyl ester carboxylesterase